MKAFFVTGTDTGVGKTVVASALCSFCSLRKGLDVGVMKPFESGTSLRRKDLLPFDAIALKEASGSQDDLSRINPYTFEAPLAPEVAAEIEHVRIDLELVDRIFEKLSASHDILFVEGAGGILVPIKADFFFSDLIQRWDIPVLLVSRLGLGTINHTLLTCHYLRVHHMRVAGIILNDLDGRPDLPAKTNKQILARYSDVPILGVFPYITKFLRGVPDREQLAEIVAEHVDVEQLLA